MAHNSDGYIMIDFKEVDFRRTNQTIDGLYKRCVDVIGTNKFILVINANGRTPLPATCSFTNNQYVIDTCIYMFAISSNDNLFIRRNDVPASDIIDDDSISVDKTWSSNKIDTELDGKADVSALAEYQPLLTPVSPVSINAENEISVDLSGKQNVLTPGDNITILNDVISATIVKSFNYTGEGLPYNRSINIPSDCHIILAIIPKALSTGSTYDYVCLNGNIPILPSGKYEGSIYLGNTSSGTSGRSYLHVSFNSGYIVTGSANAQYNLDVNDMEYIVYYI